MVHVGRCARTCILRYARCQCRVRQQNQNSSLYQQILNTSTCVAVESALVPELVRGRCIDLGPTSEQHAGVAATKPKFFPIM